MIDRVIEVRLTLARVTLVHVILGALGLGGLS